MTRITRTCFRRRVFESRSSSLTLVLSSGQVGPEEGGPSDEPRTTRLNRDYRPSRGEKRVVGVEVSSTFTEVKGPE